MKIYVASSWSNQQQPMVVDRLRGLGHEVYDFRTAGSRGRGFNWAEVDSDYMSWTVRKFVDALGDPFPREACNTESVAIDAADALILLLPTDWDSHIQLGYAVGQYKVTVIVHPVGGQNVRPALMYAMADKHCVGTDELFKLFAAPDEAPERKNPDGRTNSATADASPT